MQAHRMIMWLEAKIAPMEDLHLPFVIDSKPEPPRFSPLTSQLVTNAQFFHPRFRYWCQEIRCRPRFNRKTWEFCYILEALSQHRLLGPQSRGLGFGCGEEPLPSVMVRHGARIVATDQSPESALQQGWASNGEYAASLDRLNKFGLISKADFARSCELREVDMNKIPTDLRQAQFDFVWSSCAFEHLGSLEHGMKFVENAMECLKPGGLAVHTTEFNLSSNIETMETPGCSVYRKVDLEELQRRLIKRGHFLYPLNLHPGTQKLEPHMDLPPCCTNPKLKLQLQNYKVTSVGLIIRKSTRPALN